MIKFERMEEEEVKEVRRRMEGSLGIEPAASEEAASTCTS